MAWVKNQKLWFNWNGKIHPCAKFPGKKKWKSLDAFPRGEVHNGEEGEMAPKSREEGEIGWKSREEGDLPSCTSPFFLYLHSHLKLNDWKTPVSFIKLSLEQYFAFKHAAEGQYEQIISSRLFTVAVFQTGTRDIFRLRQSKEELDGAREKRGSFFPLSVRLSCSPCFPCRLRSYLLKIW